MRCVQWCACPRPLHLNLSPRAPTPLINYDLLYDSTAFRLTVNIPIEREGSSSSFPMTINTEYSARSNRLYETALSIVQKVVGRSNIRFGLGRRFNRTVSIMENDTATVPNLFQLSAGETALLNMFFTILRDFDLAGASFEKAEDVRGIVLYQFVVKRP